MSSHRRQAVDKLERGADSRQYAHLLSSEEGEDAAEAHSHHHQARSRRHPTSRPAFQRGQQEPEYQQPEYQEPYAYPPAHAHPFHAAHFGPAPGLQQLARSSVGGSTPTSNNGSDHASDTTCCAESEFALSHQATLPISGNNGESISKKIKEKKHRSSEARPLPRHERVRRRARGALPYPGPAVKDSARLLRDSKGRPISNET